MQDENRLRQQLGISQELLANLLGISRDLLAQYELGRRSIPTSALLRLTHLEILLQKTSNALVSKLEKPIAGTGIKGDGKLSEFARLCLFEAEKQTRKLEAMEEKLAQYNRLLQIIPNFRKEMADNTVEMATLNLLEQIAREKTKKFNEETLTILRIRISGLQHQAAEALAITG